MKYLFPICWLTLVFGLCISSAVTSLIGREDLGALFSLLTGASIFLFFVISIVVSVIIGTKADKNAPVIRTPIPIYLVILLLLGALCVTGLYLLISEYLAAADTEATDGIVVAIEKKVEGGKTSYKPLVEYKVGDNRYQCRGAVWSNPAFYSVGDHVHVRYKIDNPESAFIDSFFQRWLGPAILLSFALLFMAMTVLGLRQRLGGKPLKAGKHAQPSGYFRFLWWEWRW